MKRSILAFMIAILLFASMITPAAYASDGPSLQALDVPFTISSNSVISNSVSANSKEYNISKGSTIKHLKNGETIVSDPKGKSVFRTNDSLSKMVSTPNGPQKASRVYNVPDKSLITGDPSMTKVYSQGELVLTVIDNQETVPDINNGPWIEYVHDMTIDRLDYFSAYWTVPSSPPNPDSNTVDFLFNGVEMYTGLAIVQPVLEWNQAGSGRWTLASWYASAWGSYRSSIVVNASPGDVIQGAMGYDGSQWYVSTCNNTTGQYSYLYSSSFGPNNVYVCCTLEGHNVNGNEDLPGDTTFSNVSFRNQGNPVDIDWLGTMNTPNGVTGLSITIWYYDDTVQLGTAN